MKAYKLNFLSVAFMYVATVMGAGFASGREIWQFFGVFGDMAYIGVLLVAVLFVFIGVITAKIARVLNDNDMGKIIVPKGNKSLTNFVGYFMALMLFTVIISMSAAGGALFSQQFGLSRSLGGALIVILVISTVIGGFGRVAGVFRYMMPILTVAVLAMCLIVIGSDLPKTAIIANPTPSPLTPTWYISAVLYLSYNVLAVIPIVATASIYAKSERHATGGALLGGVFLGCLALLLTLAMKTDPNFSQSMDMPMLGFSTLISPVINIIYTGILMFAIYASATSNYYSFTTKLKEGKYKNIKIVSWACLGFLFGLVGFTNVISFMFPIEGFLGLGIIAMLITNFVLIKARSRL